MSSLSTRFGYSSDVNGNFLGDFDDLNAVLDNWSTTCFYPGDFNNDGAVNFLDLEIILDQWGESCAPSQQAAGSTGGSAATPPPSGKGVTCPVVGDLGFHCHDSFGAYFDSSSSTTQAALIEAMKAMTDYYLSSQ